MDEKLYERISSHLYSLSAFCERISSEIKELSIYRKGKEFSGIRESFLEIKKKEKVEKIAQYEKNTIEILNRVAAISVLPKSEFKKSHIEEIVNLWGRLAIFLDDFMNLENENVEAIEKELERSNTPEKVELSKKSIKKLKLAKEKTASNDYDKAVEILNEIPEEEINTEVKYFKKKFSLFDEIKKIFLNFNLDKEKLNELLKIINNKFIKKSNDEQISFFEKIKEILSFFYKEVTNNTKIVKEEFNKLFEKNNFNLFSDEVFNNLKSNTFETINKINNKMKFLVLKSNSNPNSNPNSNSNSNLNPNPIKPIELEEVDKISDQEINNMLNQNLNSIKEELRSVKGFTNSKLFYKLSLNILRKYSQRVQVLLTQKFYEIIQQLKRYYDSNLQRAYLKYNNSDEVVSFYMNSIQNKIENNIDEFLKLNSIEVIDSTLLVDIRNFFGVAIGRIYDKLKRESSGDVRDEFYNLHIFLTKIYKQDINHTYDLSLELCNELPKLYNYDISKVKQILKNNISVDDREHYLFSDIFGYYFDNLINGTMQIEYVRKNFEKLIISIEKIITKNLDLENNDILDDQTISKPNKINEAKEVKSNQDKTDKQTLVGAFNNLINNNKKSKKTEDNSNDLDNEISIGERREIVEIKNLIEKNNYLKNILTNLPKDIYNVIKSINQKSYRDKFVIFSRKVIEDLITYFDINKVENNNSKIIEFNEIYYLSKVDKKSFEKHLINEIIGNFNKNKDADFSQIEYIGFDFKREIFYKIVNDSELIKKDEELYNHFFSNLINEKLLNKFNKDRNYIDDVTKLEIFVKNNLSNDILFLREIIATEILKYLNNIEKDYLNFIYDNLISFNMYLTGIINFSGNDFVEKIVEKLFNNSTKENLDLDFKNLINTINEKLDEFKNARNNSDEKKSEVESKTDSKEEDVDKKEDIQKKKEKIQNLINESILDENNKKNIESGINKLEESVLEKFSDVIIESLDLLFSKFIRKENYFILNEYNIEKVFVGDFLKDLFNKILNDELSATIPSGRFRVFKKTITSKEKINSYFKTFMFEDINELKENIIKKVDFKKLKKTGSKTYKKSIDNLEKHFRKNFINGLTNCRYDFCLDLFKNLNFDNELTRDIFQNEELFFKYVKTIDIESICGLPIKYNTNNLFILLLYTFLKLYPIDIQGLKKNIVDSINKYKLEEKDKKDNDNLEEKKRNENFKKNLNAEEDTTIES